MSENSEINQDELDTIVDEDTASLTVESEKDNQKNTDEFLEILDTIKSRITKEEIEIEKNRSKGEE